MAGSKATSISGAGSGARMLLFLEEIKVQHSVFALPFAVAASFLAFGGWPDRVEFVWIIVAMVSARTLGMAANRLIDAEIDARNPRTASRGLPSGRLRSRHVLAWMAASVVLLGISVSQLDELAWYLSPLVLIVLIGYPYAKRFTWLSHFALGTVYLIVPPAVWIALTGGLDAGAVLMGVGGMFWVAGFDVIYATADIDIDREQGIHSIPARFGIAGALYSARVFHAVTIAALIAAGVLLEVSFVYYVGVAAAGVLLAYEHSLISPRDLSRLGAAFFTMNGIIAIVFGTFAAVGTVVD
ncbi:MAG: UbiA family prenyltransferase [Chloroflexi bacterium]|nr:UbiA family prenyltransferase [Chloroflexota bacterium]MCH8102901.1 UbiA family prenyltransferase [Chloroflexota bacterium]